LTHCLLFLDFTQNVSDEALGKAQVLQRYIHAYRNAPLLFSGGEEVGRGGEYKRSNGHNWESAFPRPWSRRNFKYVLLLPVYISNKVKHH